MFRFDTALRRLIESKLLLGNSDPDSELGRILGLPLYSLKFAPWRRSSGGQSDELSSPGALGPTEESTRTGF